MPVLTKQPKTPTKERYINPIEQVWIEEQSKPVFTPYSTNKYENGMFITICNSRKLYNKVIGDFRDIYISILKALNPDEKSIPKRLVIELQGGWDYGRERLQLPTEERLLQQVINKNIIMIAGVHNYRKDDIRSAGKQYCHTHFYLYNIHKHLPSDPVALAKVENEIIKKLNRYSGVGKLLQNTVKIHEVGVGKYSLTDNVTPHKLYDYLRSPIDNPEKENVINYIANNRHLKKVQYPLFTIFSQPEYRLSTYQPQPIY